MALFRGKGKKKEYQLSYYGFATNLSFSYRVWGTTETTSVGDYILFGGTNVENSGMNPDVYNKSLVHSNAPVLRGNKKREGLAAASTGNYALFCGGIEYGAYGNNGYTALSYVDAYNTSLTRSNAPDLNAPRMSLGGANVGNYALIFGGEHQNAKSAVVDTYNTSLVHSVATNLSSARRYSGGKNISNYALIFGGQDSNNYFVYPVDVYNNSLTHSTIADLAKGDYMLRATVIGDYMLIPAGGQMSNVVDVYNKSLTHSYFTYPIRTSCIASTTLGKNALLGGGYYYSSGNWIYVSTVNVYDESLVHSVTTDLSTGRREMLANTIGKYALFAGGSTANDRYGTDKVEAYTLI